MDSGATVYEGYVGVTPTNFWINEGTVTDIVADGQPLVRYHGMLMPMGDKWRATKAEAAADIVSALHRHIGDVRKQIDKLRTELLNGKHDEQEVAA